MPHVPMINFRFKTNPLRADDIMAHSGQVARDFCLKNRVLCHIRP